MCSRGMNSESVNLQGRYTRAQTVLSFCLAVYSLHSGGDVFSMVDFGHCCFSHPCMANISSTEQLIIHLVEDPGLKHLHCLVLTYSFWTSRGRKHRTQVKAKLAHPRGSPHLLPSTTSCFALSTEIPFYDLHLYNSPWIPFFSPPQHFVGTMILPTQNLKRTFDDLTQSSFQSSNTWVIRDFRLTIWMLITGSWKIHEDSVLFPWTALHFISSPCSSPWARHNTTDHIGHHERSFPSWIPGK